MALKGKSFNYRGDAVDRIMMSWERQVEGLDQKMLAAMNAATNIVFALARSKRPMMGVVGYGGNRKEYKPVDGRIKNRQGQRRVSDPDAPFGVPVRTGTLRMSIQKDVQRNGPEKVTGMVWTDLYYAKYVENGTSKMAARPFMQQAFILGQAGIKKAFGDMVHIDSRENRDTMKG